MREYISQKATQMCVTLVQASDKKGDDNISHLMDEFFFSSPE